MHRATAWSTRRRSVSSVDALDGARLRRARWRAPRRGPPPRRAGLPSSEVAVHGGPGDADGGPDLVDSRLGEARVREQLGRRVEDLLGGVAAMRAVEGTEVEVVLMVVGTGAPGVADGVNRSLRWTGLRSIETGKGFMGIVAAGTYLPCPPGSSPDRRRARHARQPRAAPGRWPSADEDTTTLGVEAARNALAGLPAEAMPQQVLLFATAEPAYLDKTNATAIHAALGLDRSVAAYDVGGAVRSAIGALRLADSAGEPTLVVLAGLRTGLPGGADERDGGDGAAAFVTGDDAGHRRGDAAPSDRGSASLEFLDRWRLPGETHSHQSGGALRRVRVRPARRATRSPTHSKPRSRRRRARPRDRDAACTPAVRVRPWRGRSASSPTSSSTTSTTVGNTGAAHAGLAAGRRARAWPSRAGRSRCSSTRRRRRRRGPRDNRPARRDRAAARRLPNSSRAGATLVSYETFLTWRGFLDREPPRRPEPVAPAAPPSLRSEDWKFGFTGSACDACGEIHLPPAAGLRELRCGRPHDPGARGRRAATIATFTVDRLAYTPSPPLVAAVLDFDGGGRFRCELTDVDAAGWHRRPGRDDVPARGHRARRAQLLLEGAPAQLSATPTVERASRGGTRWRVTGSATGSRSSGWGARGSESTGTTAPTTCSSTRSATRSTSAGVDQGRRGRVLGGHDGVGRLGPHAVAPAAHRLQAGHARREHVRDGLGVVPQRVLRGRVRRVRHRHGHRCREAEGQRVLGPRDRARCRRTAPTRTSPRRRCSACSAPAYCNKYGVDRRRVQGGDHAHRVEEPPQRRAEPARAVPEGGAEETIANSPLMAGNLGIFDCSGVSDGAAAAVIVRAEDAHKYTDKPALREGAVVRGRPRRGCRRLRPTTTRPSPRSWLPPSRRLPAGRHHRPACELAMAEVHDCFTPTELVLMEDLGFAERGFAWKEVLAGTFDLDGELPVNPDGGLKAFGHPIGASGLRMLFECWLQLRGEARRAPDQDRRGGQDARAHPQPRRLSPASASATWASSGVSRSTASRVGWEICGFRRFSRQRGERCARRMTSPEGER